MNGITFIKSNGGITAPLAGEDHISGMVFYANSDMDMQLIGSVDTAEQLGIKIKLHSYLQFKNQ